MQKLPEFSWVPMAIVSLLTSAAKPSLVIAECRPREGDANPSGSRVSKPDSNPPSRLRAHAPYGVPNQAEPDRDLLEHLP